MESITIKGNTIVKKNLAIIFFTLCHVTLAWAANPPEKITYNSVEYLKVENRSAENTSSVEYIPTGESTSDWKSLISINHYNDIEDPEQIAAAIEKNIQAESNGVAYPIQHIDKETKDVIQPFVIVGVANGEIVLEYNVWRYKKSNTSKGIVGLQYAMRKIVDSKVDLSKFDSNDIVEELKKLPINEY